MSGIGPVGPGQEFPTIEPARCWDIPAVFNREMLASDSVGVAAPPVGAFASTAVSRAAMSNLWLPAGHHWDLHIEHDHRISSGAFVSDAEWKWCWHITVSPWNSVDAMREVLHSKHAEVHFVIGGRPGTAQPVVIQCLPLNQFGKGLVHIAGQPETNRAKVIQVEVCANVSDMDNFQHYQALANLFAMCTHGKTPRVHVSNRLARSFANPKRFTSNGYKKVKGHHGHEHVSQNTHIDPTRKFKGATVVSLANSAPHNL